MSSQLFSELKIRNVTFKNRVFVSPMCQYSAVDGVPNDWHLVHLGSRASGGAALIIAEATGVVPEGRISVGCLGIWNETQVEAFKRITTFIKTQHAVPGIQLAHAGRKSSFDLPEKGSKLLTPEQGGWETVGPSPIAYSETYSTPHELTKKELDEQVQFFVKATERAVKAGFEVIELHMAHGYLFHEFLSPISNKRVDEFGGSLENRMRFPLMVAKAVREILSQDLPLFVRISATDWVTEGWNENDSVVFCQELKKLNVDFIDVSSGGNVQAKIPVGPLYQVPFAKLIKEKTGMLTGAVGMITKPEEAEGLVSRGEVDAVLMAREFLREPYWAIKAAKTLGAEVAVPHQYLRAY